MTSGAQSNEILRHFDRVSVTQRDVSPTELRLSVVDKQTIRLNTPILKRWADDAKFKVKS